jgi:glycosyltransferase involved in cell wall biosynthesis
MFSQRRIKSRFFSCFAWSDLCAFFGCIDFGFASCKAAFIFKDNRGEGMKIAVIDHVGNPGGGSRVARALLPALKRVRPHTSITFFGNPHSIKREKQDEIFKAHGIGIHPLASTKLAGRDLFNIQGSRHVVNLFQRKFAEVLSSASFYLSGAVHKELESLVTDFDIAFFIWPFHLKCPELNCPMAGIFHDFNYKYFFSGQVMVPWVLELLNREMPVWLSRATPIVSTEFMRGELQKFYPEFGHKTKVVPVAPTSHMSAIDKVMAKEIVKRRGIEQQYILCPTNICSHKNAGPLVAAFSELKKKYPDLLLVFTGLGTEVIDGRACAVGVERGCEPKDVHGLGYVTNEEIDALIQCARVVVNPSLYEGGNVPGFDAWERGTPVAMSKIPPFEEHVSVHKVHAEFFNPRSPEEIAEAIDRILSNPEQMKRIALQSKEAISHFTWERAAEGYLKVFEGMSCARA